MLVILRSFSNKEGKSYTTNHFLTKFFASHKGKGDFVSTKTISSWIHNLIENGYITSNVIRLRSGEVDKREITIVKEI